MEHDDRTPPEDLLELARLALTAGLDVVHLGFEGLGADFPAPIGWNLMFSRVQPGSTHALDSPFSVDFVRINAQVDDVPSAYVAGEHWDVGRLREWILADRAGIAAPTGIERTNAEEDAELMTAAWLRGWSAERTIDRVTAESLTRAFGMDIPPLCRYMFTADNNFYCVDGHAAHRKTGAPTSIRLWMTRENLVNSWDLGIDEHLRPTENEEIVRRVTNIPPWHAEVARFDEELEEWVL